MRSSFKVSDVPALVIDTFGLDVVVETELDSYDDQNFLVKVNPKSTKPVNIQQFCQHGYVLKILNSDDSKNPDIIGVQTRMILHLAKKGFPTPEPVLSVNANYQEEVQATYSTDNGCIHSKHIARLFEFKPGKTLDKVPLTTQLCYEIGLGAGRLDLTLQSLNISDESLSSMKSKWNLSELPGLRTSTHVISSNQQRAVVEKIIDEFEECLSTNYDCFSKGLIHGDLNECNILVEKHSTCNSSKSFRTNQEQQNVENNNESKVSGPDDGYGLCSIIDFGDSVYSPYVFEVAIAITYVMLNKHGIPPLEGAHYVLKGYLEHIKLTDLELKYLRIFICARLTQSLIMGNIAHSKDPENEYILIHVKRIWPVLENLWRKSNNEVFNEIIKC
ncbi:hydroxylysine kinase [Elysia marginata]|uniref:Hydroxylysine kinase n=1 Tax=Elysia marginata TaxID=1093978 RepID=A0AAV4HIL0_9GAST|nr:hydroxylysine kinase [Elysia marginata]